MPSRIFCAFFALMLLIAFSCNRRVHESKSKTKSVNDPGNVIMTRDEIRGMKLFMIHCNRCHPAGDKGTGKSIVNKNLPDAAIRFQVRHGLGDMPSFTEDQITDADVDKIISFIRILKTNR